MNTHGTVQPRYRSANVALTHLYRRIVTPPVAPLSIGVKNRASGGDYDHWNDALFEPWKGEQGLSDFAIGKLSEGIGYVDNSFAPNWPGYSWHPVCGPYHYARSQWTGEQQGSFFMQCATPYLNKIQLLGWDFEGYGNTFTTQFMVETLRGMLYLKARFDGQIYLYTNRSLREWLRSESLKFYGEDMFLQFKFWYAAPVNPPNPDYDPPLPVGVPKWDALQYDWTFYGPRVGIADTTIDFNVYNGTREQMLIDFGYSQPPPEEDVITQAELDQIRANLVTIRNKANASIKIIDGGTPPPPATETYVCTADSLFIRQTPGGAATGAYLFLNQECQVDSSQDLNGVTWHHHDGGPSGVAGWSVGTYLVKKA